METGKLNRLWERRKHFFHINKKVIKTIIAVIGIIIAIIPVMGTLNQSYGGIKGYYTYNEQEYIQLENLVKENIVEDPCTDLQMIEDSNVTYTCNYDSKENTWTLKISKDRVVVVNADISYTEEGTFDISTSHESKAAYWIGNTIAIIFDIALIAIVCYFLTWIILWTLIGLYMIACLIEKAIISIQRKKQNSSSK